MLQQETSDEIRFSGDERVAALLQCLHEMADLQHLASLAEWDQNTAMPDGAAEVRGYQMATLKGMLHERQTAARLGQLLGELGDVVRGDAYTDADRGLVRVALRDYEQETKLPRTLVEELARVEATGFSAWKRAREAGDFAIFAPLLTRNIALQREAADLLGYGEKRYDALLDVHEPGLTVRKADAWFEPVREVSLALLKRIEARGQVVDADCLEGDFPEGQQLLLCKRLLGAMGYDLLRGQLAQSPHPFTTSFGSPYDVRLTVRTSEHHLQESVMAAIHEGGHALYEQGSDPALLRTPLAGGASMGAHESQSRLWENAIGRSEAYWEGQYGLVQELFPVQFGSVNSQAFAQALNKVEPSLIRIEADEVTYNLHIIIRYELENMLINGELGVESLPRMWNEKYREYLGVVPANDAEGVLQDIHWTGMLGYFPTYTLGNLYAAQIYARTRAVFPDFDERLAQGDTVFALEWLRERMYRVGGMYPTEELMERVSGAAPDAGYFTRYLTSKFERIYDLPAM